MYNNLFDNSSVFGVVADVDKFKKRIEYLNRLWLKYEHYDFGNSFDNSMKEIFANQMLHIPACGSVLAFRVSDDDNTIGRLVNGSFCRQRVCPLCQRRKSLKLYSNILQMLDTAKDKYKFLHVTLTVPNCNVRDISNSITDIFNYSKELFHSLKAFRGVIRSLEVTQNVETREMHPHLHCLVVVDKSYFTSRNYVKYDILRTMWGNIINCNLPHVWMRKVNDLDGAVREVVKYASKPIDIDENYRDDFKNFYYYCSVSYALHNRRLIQCFGICAELSKKFHINLNDDEEEPIDTPFRKQLYYRFSHERQDFIPAPEMVFDFSVSENSLHNIKFKKNISNLKSIKKNLIEIKSKQVLRILGKMKK